MASPAVGAGDGAAAPGPASCRRRGQPGGSRAMSGDRDVRCRLFLGSGGDLPSGRRRARHRGRLLRGATPRARPTSRSARRPPGTRRWCRWSSTPSRVGYDQFLEVFWSAHDPTQVNRQGPDVGSQYRSAIFYHSPGAGRRGAVRQGASRKASAGSRVRSPRGHRGRALLARRGVPPAVPGEARCGELSSLTRGGLAVFLGGLFQPPSLARVNLASSPPSRAPRGARWPLRGRGSCFHRLRFLLPAS